MTLSQLEPRVFFGVQWPGDGMWTAAPWVRGYRVAAAVFTGL